MKYGRKAANLRTKSCSDIFELEELQKVARNTRSWQEVAEQLVESPSKKPSIRWYIWLETTLTDGIFDWKRRWPMVYLIANDSDRWYIWLDTRLLRIKWTKNGGSEEEIAKFLTKTESNNGRKINAKHIARLMFSTFWGISSRKICSYPETVPRNRPKFSITTDEEERLLRT